MMIVMPVGGGATGGSMGGARTNLEGERFGSSELRATISSTRTDAENSTATGKRERVKWRGRDNLGASAAPGTMGVGTGGGSSSLTETTGQGGGSFFDATLATTEAQGEGGGSVDLATAAGFESGGEGGGAAMPISFSSDMLGEGRRQRFSYKYGARQCKSARGGNRRSGSPRRPLRRIWQRRARGQDVQLDPRGEDRPGPRMFWALWERR